MTSSVNYPVNQSVTSRTKIALGTAVVGVVILYTWPTTVLVGVASGAILGCLVPSMIERCKRGGKATQTAVESGDATAASNQVLSFLKGGYDSQLPQSRTYTGILAQTDAYLEEAHDWVQQIFPTDELSSVHKEAKRWVVDKVIAAAIRNDAGCQANLRAAYQRIFSFYQLGGDLRRPLWWVTPDNHNFKRLARILRSLNLAGLHKEANELMERLTHIYNHIPGAKRAIDTKGAFGFWRNASTQSYS